MKQELENVLRALAAMQVALFELHDEQIGELAALAALMLANSELQARLKTLKRAVD